MDNYTNYIMKNKVKVAEKDVKKFNEVINDFSNWMKKNKPSFPLLDDDIAEWEHDNLVK